MNSTGHYVSQGCRRPPKNLRTLFWRLIEGLAAHYQFLQHIIFLVLLDKRLAFGLNIGALIALCFFKVVDVLCELVGKLLKAALDQERIRGAGHTGLVGWRYAWEIGHERRRERGGATGFDDFDAIVGCPPRVQNSKVPMRAGAILSSRGTRPPQAIN